MPLPKPRKDESESEFMSRCMSDNNAEREFPDTSQRSAICNSQWDDSRKLSEALEGDD